VRVTRFPSQPNPTRRDPPTLVHQFLITLSHVEPLVWRRIQVPQSYTFWNLHVVIQDGYAELLKIIANPKHPRPKSMVQWLGEAFDPDSFDPKRVALTTRRNDGRRPSINEIGHSAARVGESLVAEDRVPEDSYAVRCGRW
jgi:Plasmid pRiA4b ORF-3-like protein